MGAMWCHGHVFVAMRIHAHAKPWAPEPSPLPEITSVTKHQAQPGGRQYWTIFS
jgi:hypothetical protein